MLRRWGACTGVALLLLVLPGCGLRAESQARPLGTDAPDTTLFSPTATPQPEGPQREQLYFVRGDELVPVARSAEEVTPERALQDLVAGPTEAEGSRGLSTALPGTGELALVGVEDGTAVVDLRGELVGNNQVLALAQVVATLDASPGISAVRFVQGGEPLQVPTADGVLTDRPVRLEDYRTLLAG